MRAAEWLLLLALIAGEALVIYVCVLGLARWLDVTRTRRRAHARGEVVR